MSTALTVLRQELLRQLGLGKIIPNAYLDSLGVTSVVSANVLRDSNKGGGEYLGYTIFRPTAATAADYIRIAGQLTVATGSLAHTGANYADTTTTAEVPELWRYGVRPDLELIDSLNRVLEFEYVTTRFALSHLSQFDGDMAKSTDTDWTDIGTTSTSAKATTLNATPEGMRSYRTVNNASANAGTRSTAYRVRSGSLVSAFTIAVTSVGTSSLQPYDATNTAVFGTAATTSDAPAELLAVQGATVPSTCKSVALNLTNTSATGDTNWNQAWLYAHDDLSCLLPASLAEGFMVPKILQLRPRVSMGTNSYAARSFDYIPLVEGQDYWLTINHADAEAYKVRFRDASFYEWPLVVEARVPQSGLVTMAADETAVVNVAKHNLLPRWKIDVLETIYNGAAYPKHPDWANQMALAKAQLLQSSNSRLAKSTAPAKPWWTPRLSAS